MDWRSCRRGLLIALAGFALALDGAAACEAELGRLRDVQIARSGGYDPFGLRDALEPFEVEVRHIGGEPCAVALALLSTSPDGRALVGDHGTIDYALQRSASASDAVPSSTSASRRSLPVVQLGEEEGARSVRLFARIPSGQVAPGGVYSDVVDAILLALDGAAGRELDRRAFTVATELRSQAQLNIVGGSAGVSGAGTYARMDFGTLAAGAERRVILGVRSTEDYVLLVSSEEGGVLRHVGDDDWAVDYQAWLDLDPVDLAQAGQVLEMQRAGPTSLRGDELTFTVRIGQVGRKLAGPYADRIEIEIRAR